MRRVGARQFADAETVRRRLKLTLQHFDIAAVELDHARVADHAHIRLNRIEQRRLFDAEQRLPARLHRGFGLICRIDGPPAGKDIFAEPDGAVHRPQVSGQYTAGTEERTGDVECRG